MRLAELFHSIQGEGKLVGVPSVFVRASGCNLRCTWCDTPYASWKPEGANIPVAEIVRKVNAFNTRHVVVTGGEPMIMPDIAELCGALREAGHHITIETAATVFVPVEVNLASLSPKLSNSTPHHAPGLAIAHENSRLNIPVIQNFINLSPDFQLKFVVTTEQDLLEIDAILQQLTGWVPSDVLLMPEGIDQATLASRAGWLADLCKRNGYRYCPRLHIELFGNKRAT